MLQGFEIPYDIANPTVAGGILGSTNPTVAGGILGSIEGVRLSLPLARLLGMFRDRTTERADSRE